MLLPVILEKFNHIAQIIQTTSAHIYSQLNAQEEDDKTSFMRSVCHNPVAVDQDTITL
jgi:hypothetical protein